MSNRNPPELVMMMFGMLARELFIASAVGNTWSTIRLSKDPFDGYGFRDNV
jgi:hypothetical protein